MAKNRNPRPKREASPTPAPEASRRDADLFESNAAAREEVDAKGGGDDADDDLVLPDETPPAPAVPDVRARMTERRVELPPTPGDPVGVFASTRPDSFEPSAAPVLPARPDSGVRAPRADDIDSFDITEEAESARSVEAAPAKQPSALSAAVEVPPVRAEIEEFIGRRETPRSAEQPAAKTRRPFTVVEMASLGTVGLIMALLGIWFVKTIIASQPPGGQRISEARPDLPMAGSLVRITAAEASWRPRRETDRVGLMDVDLPVPGQRPPAIIPEVAFTIDPAASASGYLRFLFLDSDGKGIGDVRVVRLVNGQLQSMDRGESVKDGISASVHASKGFLDMSGYLTYAAGDRPRWHVEVAESARYDAPDRDWKVLGTFDVPNDLRD